MYVIYEVHECNDPSSTRCVNLPNHQTLSLCNVPGATRFNTYKEMFVPYCSNNVLPSHQCFTRHQWATRHQENGNDCDQTQKRLLHNEQHCFHASQVPFMPSRCYHPLLSAFSRYAFAKHRKRQRDLVAASRVRIFENLVISVARLTVPYSSGHADPQNSFPFFPMQVRFNLHRRHDILS